MTVENHHIKIQQGIRKIRPSDEYTESKYHSDLDRSDFMSCTLKL